MSDRVKELVDELMATAFPLDRYSLESDEMHQARLKAREQTRERFMRIARSHMQAETAELRRQVAELKAEQEKMALTAYRDGRYKTTKEILDELGHVPPVEPTYDAERMARDVRRCVQEAADEAEQATGMTFEEFVKANRNRREYSEYSQRQRIADGAVVRQQHESSGRKWYICTDPHHGYYYLHKDGEIRSGIVGPKGKFTGLWDTHGEALEFLQRWVLTKGK